MGFGSILANLRGYAQSRIRENKDGLKNFTKNEAGRGFDSLFGKVAGNQSRAKQGMPVKKAVAPVMAKPKAKKAKKGSKRAK